jgi:hypothetical protein
MNQGQDPRAVRSATSHRLAGNYTFAFHNNEEVGPSLLSQIAKKTGLRPEDL